VGDEIAFSGHADDAEQGALAAHALSWEIVLQHCAEPGDCHEHVAMAVSGVAGGSFPAPDHAYPSYLEFRVTATDALGLTGTGAVAVQPETATLELTTDPVALELAIDGAVRTAPFTIEAIVGSVHSLSAVSPQDVGGTSHEFGAWSDGGEATHLITLAAGASTLQATFAAVGADAGEPEPTGDRCGIELDCEADAGAEPEPADAGASAGNGGPGTGGTGGEGTAPGDAGGTAGSEGESAAAGRDGDGGPAGASPDAADGELADGDSDCGCAVPGARTRDNAISAWLIAAAGWCLRRRRARSAAKPR
jgi:hypothetical protein